jgi:hypothetical protein
LNPPAFFYATAHEIKIDQQTGYCYVAGTRPGAGQPERGLVILDLNANPTNPPMRGNWNVNYTHDLSILDGKAYIASIYDGIVYVLDVTQPGTPPTVGIPWTYPSAFTHNTWPSADSSYLVTTDENPGGHLRMWDISDLDHPMQTGDWISPNGALVHNAYLRGNTCYMSHYRDGLRVADVSDPYNIEGVAWYDTHPASGDGFAGAWGCYCFAADPSIVYITDIQTGTYILRVTGRLQGTVRNAGTQAPIPGAEIAVGDTTVVSNAQGVYTAQVGLGPYTVDCTKYGYDPTSDSTTVAPGRTTTLDFNLTPVPSGSVTGLVRSTNLDPIPVARLDVETTPLTILASPTGDYDFPLVPIGSYDITASKFGFRSQTLPVTVNLDEESVINFDLVPSFYAADMETSPGPWTVTGDAIAGLWTRVIPNGTGGGQIQPAEDHTPFPGLFCWITGQSPPGANPSMNDVDEGSTILTTQIFDLTSLSNPILSYWRWFVNNGNANVDDPWVVEVSSNGGTSWVAIESSLGPQAAWTEISVRIADYVTLSPQFQVRFIARDLGLVSIVEAGVDDFQIYDPETTSVSDPGAIAPGAGPMLLGNFPNPFNPATAIRFELAKGGPVKLRIFDATGRTVRVLVDGPLAAGQQSLVWDGRNEASLPMASGVYYYQIETGGFSESRSMVLAK